MNEIWSDDPAVLEDALRNCDGRRFKTRGGLVVELTNNDHTEDDGIVPEHYVARCGKGSLQGLSARWYYLPNGRIWSSDNHCDDIVSVLVTDNVPSTPEPIEEPGNPDFLRLVEYARNEEAAELIRKQYAKFRLLENLELRELGHTGKRRRVSWENASGLWRLLDHDKLAYSVPWTISEGEDIHEVFEKHRPNSCMRDCSKHELRTLYSLNPDTVKTAHIPKGAAGILQSAVCCLVWYGKESVYIDRRYSDGYLPGMSEAIVRGLAKQLHDSTGKTVKQLWKGDIVPGIPAIEKPVQFTLNRESDLMPWCDSVSYVVDYDDETVTLSTSSGHNRVCCQEQSGTDIADSGRCRCCSCGCRVDEADSRCDESGATYCNDCYSERYSYCSWSEQDCPADEIAERTFYGYESLYQRQRHAPAGGYGVSRTSPDWHTMYISDDAISNYFTELTDGNYCDDILVIEDNRGNYYAPDDEGEYMLTEDGETYHPDDVVTTLNEQIQPKDDCTELHDGTWCLTSEAVDVDGEWYHEDDLPEGYEIDDADNTFEVEETEETPVQTVDSAIQFTPCGKLVPPGYRLAKLGEILPKGSRYPFCGVWVNSGECGKLYGKTSYGSSLPYIFPIDPQYISRNDIPYHTLTECQVTE
jgi:hypothetical protein